MSDQSGFTRETGLAGCLVTIFSPDDCCGNTRAPEQARVMDRPDHFLSRASILSSPGIRRGIETGRLDRYKYVIILVNFF